MKALTITFLICLCISIAAVATKPTDQECIQLARQRSGVTDADIMQQLLQSIEYNQYTINVEDHIFYKSIYSALDGHHLGTGIFGTVILN